VCSSSICYSTHNISSIKYLVLPVSFTFSQLAGGLFSASCMLSLSKINQSRVSWGTTDLWGCSGAVRAARWAARGALGASRRDMGTDGWNLDSLDCHSSSKDCASARGRGEHVNTLCWLLRGHTFNSTIALETNPK